MQLGHLSNSFRSFFSLFTQIDQDLNGEEEIIHSQSKVSEDVLHVSIENSRKRTNDDDEDTKVPHKRQRLAMDEKDKHRIMTFNRHSRQKVKETHSKTISFVKVKQLNPPKVRSVSQSTDGFHVGSASNIEERYPSIESPQSPFYQRFPMDRKTFLPFVMPFSTPSRGYPDFKKYQSTARNVNRGFYQFAEPPQRARPRFPPPPSLVMTTEDLIDEFLRDADPFQWNYPIPHHIEVKIKSGEKQYDLCSSSSTILSHDDEQEEGQSDV